MLKRVCQSEFADEDTVLDLECIRTAGLVRALDGCMHPRVGRLLRQLSQARCTEDFERLTGEVKYLLTLTFGEAEAQRRLQ
ncbi:MAG: hypothetical protein GAK30_02410 [Paracidovorax wautersii]|uniref:Uncharacterized protein n=1 Tax=Paracidovorax wautersii TaxID=1177982 RepID=A0A7V8FN31_9BURK|nr:MAG: hypothetical protein GAK30_02410 [Paracidovorax wautersii]